MEVGLLGALRIIHADTQALKPEPVLIHIHQVEELIVQALLPNLIQMRLAQLMAVGLLGVLRIIHADTQALKQELVLTHIRLVEGRIVAQLGVLIINPIQMHRVLRTSHLFQFHRIQFHMVLHQL